MLDFGKHTFHVWASYGVTVGLLLALIVASLVQARAAKARLDRAEKTDG
ncbi:heme exporter protein CcmD [Loktanella sp. IMCC34160]|nr:heme exporter protein CcmD [Loktanella sp. IMCC34160]RYG92380.1 heme exporter protein CcmD [Loktanella sp. IMCC34160]